MCSWGVVPKSNPAVMHNLFEYKEALQWFPSEAIPAENVALYTRRKWMTPHFQKREESNSVSYNEMSTVIYRDNYSIAS